IGKEYISGHENTQNNLELSLSLPFIKTPGTTELFQLVCGEVLNNNCRYINITLLCAFLPATEPNKNTQIKLFPNTVSINVEYCFARLIL
ncbi:MAG: hypothetical protein P1P72_10525, partial [ANME-2 cluster archaeon]|nr:hypothetical protein [ANME-2 cluster archaeon]